MNEAAHEFLEVDGLRLHYLRKGEGPPIVFLHGFPEFWYTWKEQLAHFSSDFQAVAFDLPGYNLSGKPQELKFYDADNLARVMSSFLRKLSPSGKVVLVGHDWGGVLCWRIAIKYPELLERLVIINAPHPFTYVRELLLNPAQRKASAYIPVMRSKNAEKILQSDNFARLRKVVFEGCLRQNAFSEEDRKAYIDAWSQPGAIAASLNYYKAIDPFSLLSTFAKYLFCPQSAKVNVPTLVIWGEKDTAITKANLNGLAKFVPNLQIKKIPTSSHWVTHEEPALVNTFIREFVSQ